MSPEKRWEIVYQHYKDSREMLSKLVEARMRLFPLVFAAMGLILFQVSYPVVAANILTGWIIHWGGAVGTTDQNSIQQIVPKVTRSLLWFALTTLVTQTF